MASVAAWCSRRLTTSDAPSRHARQCASRPEACLEQRRGTAIRWPTMSSTKASDLPGTSSASRKLIAVVYADMVGYSRLIGLGDSGTLERLRALRNSVIDPAIAEHGGRLVQ